MPRMITGSLITALISIVSVSASCTHDLDFHSAFSPELISQLKALRYQEILDPAGLKMHEGFELLPLSTRIHIFGRDFEITGYLGAGAQGYVYLVSDGQTSFALKYFYHSGLSMRESISKLRKLKDNGFDTVEVMETDFSRGAVLLTYVDGVDLQKLLAREPYMGLISDAARTLLMEQQRELIDGMGKVYGALGPKGVYPFFKNLVLKFATGKLVIVDPE